MIAKLNIITTLGAILLFLFPWLDVQCSGRTFVTQTGVQTIYGGVSASKELNQLSTSTQGAQNKPERSSAKAGILPGIALATTIAACAFAFFSFIHVRHRMRAPMLCAIALFALLLQLAIDFPIRRDLAEQMAKSPPPTATGDPFAAAGQEMGKAILAQIQVKYRPAFYLELLALGIPTLIFVNGLLDKLKRQDAS